MSQTPTLAEILEGNVPLTSNRKHIEALTSQRESRVLALVLAPGAQLSPAFIPPLLEVLETLPEGGAIDLFLDTLGPASEETWRIVSVLRERFDRYTAIIPFAASPGATQVALGADELLMGEASSLSPIDRVAGADAGEDVDARDIYHAIEFASRMLGLDRPPPDSPLFARLFERLDPVRIGRAERLREAHRAVARRCLATHLDPERDAARIELIIDELSRRALTRQFPITRRDCEHRLGLEIIKPVRELWSNIWSLRDYYRQMLDIEGDLQLGDHQHYTVGFDGFIDTVDERRVLLTVARVDERGRRIADKAVLRRWVRPVGRDVVLDEELEL